MAAASLFARQAVEGALLSTPACAFCAPPKNIVNIVNVAQRCLTAVHEPPHFTCTRVASRTGSCNTLLQTQCKGEYRERLCPCSLFYG